MCASTVGGTGGAQKRRCRRKDLYESKSVARDSVPGTCPLASRQLRRTSSLEPHVRQHGERHRGCERKQWELLLGLKALFVGAARAPARRCRLGTGPAPRNTQWSITSNPKCLTTPKTKGSSRDRFVTTFPSFSSTFRTFPSFSLSLSRLGSSSSSSHY